MGLRDWRRILRVGMAAFLCVLVLAMTPWTTDPSNGIKILLYHCASLVFAIIWLVGSFLSREPVQRPHLFIGVLVAFLTVNVVAGLQSDFMCNSAVEISKFTSLFFLYLTTSRAYRTEAEIRPLLVALCSAVAIASVYGFLQKLNFDPFPWDPAVLLTDSYRELPATFGNPNLAAHTLVLCDIVALYLATIRGYRWCLTFLVLFNLHHYFTGQRGGAVALAIAGLLVCCGWFMQTAKLRPHRAVVVTFLLTVFVASVTAAGVMLVMKVRTGTPYPLDLALLVRYQSYSSAARMIVDRPFLGYGPGNYAIESTAFWTPYEQRWFIEKNMFNANVHNDALECAIDAGVFSAGLYVTFLVLAVCYGLYMGFSGSQPSRRRLGFALAALFCAFAVDGLFGFNLRTPVSAVLVFVMAGVLEGVSSTRNGENDRIRIGWKKSLAWRVCVLVVVLANAIFGARVFMSDVLQQRAKGAIYWQAYEEADAMLARGEAIAPWDWRFAFLRGDVAYRQGFLQVAVGHFERCRVRNPNYLPVLTNLGQTYLSLALGEEVPTDVVKTKVLAQSVRYAERAIELCPGLPQAEELMGRILLAHAHLLLRSSARQPDEEYTVAELWELARTHLSTAISNGAPNQGELWRLLAETEIEEGDANTAEMMLVSASKAEPEDPANWEVFLQFASTYGRYEALFRTLNGYLNILRESQAPETAQLGQMYTFLALAYESQGQDLDAAERAHVDAISVCPNTESTWSQFAGFASRCSRMTRFQNAVRSSIAAIRGSGNTCPTSAASIGRVWEEGPEVLPAVAASLYEEIETLATSNDTFQKAMLMGWAVDLLVQELDCAPPTTPRICDAYLMLGLCCRVLKRPEQADRLLAAALPMFPSDTARTLVIERHARILLGQGEAAELLRLVLEHEAFALRSLMLSELRAQALANEGRLAEARLAYRTVLLRFPLSPDQKQSVQKAIDELNKRIAESNRSRDSS